jgi:hypothetical protein
MAQMGWYADWQLIGEKALKPELACLHPLCGHCRVSVADIAPETRPISFPSRTIIIVGMP